MDFLDILLTTLIKRPYVVIFLLTYLVLSTTSRGVLKTLLYLLAGYVIAWGSEYGSINYGFPYGLYHYVYENLKGEWLNNGVPVWDSVSYVFLCYAGLGVAKKVLLKSNQQDAPDFFHYRKLVTLAALSALFVLILDIVIDPLAHRGDRWFLGKIYYYVYPGWYFDVPLSNFLGWALVAFTINLTGLMIEKHIPSVFHKSLPSWSDQGPLLLYFGIFLFNWGLTLYIGEWFLALVDLLWISIPVGFLIKKNLKSKALK